MSDYTPTTEKIRLRYAQLMSEVFYAETKETYLAWFDNMLAAHDAEVAKQVAGKIAEAIWNEEQRAFADLVEKPTDRFINGAIAGLQWARLRAESVRDAAARGESAE